MLDIMRKEMKLSASALTYFYIAFGLMFFLPGYPVACAALFVCVGISQSFQNCVAANDILFSALLPVAKKDVVKGKYLFACFIELCGFLVMTFAALMRMTVFADSATYRGNALMNANPFALGVVLFVFGIFNLIYIGGFFKTACRFVKPLMIFLAVCSLTVGASEAAHYIPGLEKLNSFGFDNIGMQLCLLAGGAVLYALLTFVSYKVSCRRFEEIDL